MTSVKFSRQVNWWEYHELIRPWLGTVDGWPMAGSVEWFTLEDGDPRRWAAVLSASEHWVLRIDTNQQALAQASQAISAAEDWPQIAEEIQNIRDFRRQHPWARRVS